MDDQESKRQELGRKLVDREVLCCVSNLMYGIRQLMHTRGFEEAFNEDADELQGLYERLDYERAADVFIAEDADMAQLEEITEEYGWWSDVLQEVYAKCCQDADPDDDLDDDARAAYIEKTPAALAELRIDVTKLVAAQANGWKWVCNTYSLEPDRMEVYEHWIVTSWLARQLDGYGEVTGEFAGLTIWGRCTTGQAISLDGVVQKIACELWPEGNSTKEEHHG